MFSKHGLNKNMSNNTNKNTDISLAVIVGLFGSISVVLGILESFFPLPIPIVRLGLANIPIMVLLYLTSVRYAFLVMTIKTILVPLFSGSFIFKISLGLPSTALAFIVMVFMLRIFKDRVTAISVGVVGSFVHMIIQLLIADYFYIDNLFSTRLTGVLLCVSTLSGILTGIITELIVSKRYFVNYLKRYI